MSGAISDVVVGTGHGVRGHEQEHRRLVPLGRRAGVAVAALHAVDVRLEGQEVAHRGRVDGRQQHDLVEGQPVLGGGDVGRGSRATRASRPAARPGRRRRRTGAPAGGPLDPAPGRRTGAGRRRLVVVSSEGSESHDGSAERLVERTLALGEHGDRLLQRELLEVVGRAVGGVRVLVRVDLEQAEDRRLGGVLVGLVEEVAAPRPRRRGELLDGVADDVLRAGLAVQVAATTYDMGAPRGRETGGDAVTLGARRGPGESARRRCLASPRSGFRLVAVRCLV